MYTHILLPTDGSDVAQRGLDHGLALAKALGAKVTILTASEVFPFPSRAMAAGWVPNDGEMKQFQRNHQEYADTILGAAKAAAERSGVSAETMYVPDTFPATAILDSAEAQGCNLIVMASHGRRGLNRLLLGSQTREVLAHSPIPVLVVR